MKRRTFLHGMLAAGAAPYVVTADGALIPLPNVVKPGPSVRDIVQLGDLPNDGPNWVFSSRALRYEWTTPGGDYLDASGALNGTNHFASQTWPTSAGQTARFNLPVELIEKLRAENTGFFLSNTGPQTPPRFAGRLGQQGTPPALHIKTRSGSFDPPCLRSCFVDGTSARCLSEANVGYIKVQPAYLKFDLSGVTGAVESATLTLTSVAINGGGNTVHVDYLKMPALIHDPARQLGGVDAGIAGGVANDQALASHPSVIFYPSFASLEDVEAAWDNVDGAVSWRAPKEIVTWEEFGLFLLRVTSPYPGNPWGSESGILTLNKYVAAGQYLELYFRFLFLVDPDAFLALNEPGVKLPGLAHDNTLFTEFNYRTHMADHMRPADRASGEVANPNVYRFSLHAYDAEHPVFKFPSNAETRNSSACLVAGRHYCIEQRVRLNTFTGDVPNDDGVTEMWIDGVKVYSDLTRTINDNRQPFFIDRIFVNIFHGGTNIPLQPFHVEFGGVCVATEYIGPPKRVAPTLPAWRRGMAVNQWKAIPGTNMSAAATPAWSEPEVHGITGPSSIVGLRSGASIDTRDSTVWTGRNGGHKGYYGNQWVKLKLSVDAPVWVEARGPTRGEDVIKSSRLYADGRPAACHSYYRHQFIEARNWAVCFGSPAVNDAGNGHPNCPVFDPVTRDYAPDLTIPDCPIGSDVILPMCKDPATEDVYIIKNHRIVRWHQSTNTWSEVADWPTQTFNIAGGWLCADTRRNRLFHPFAMTVDLTTFETTARTLTGRADHIAAVKESGSGAVFQQHPTEASKDCFLVRNAADTGGTVYRINASTFRVDRLATTGGASIPAPQFNIRINNRFLPVPQYGGIVYIPVYGGNVWFLRTQ